MLTLSDRRYRAVCPFAQASPIHGANGTVECWFQTEV